MVPFTSSHSGGKQQGTFTANTDISEGTVTTYVFIFLSLYTPALPRRLCFHLCLFACLFVYWSVSRITQKWLNSTKLGWRTGLSPELTPWIFGAALEKGMDLNNFSRKYAWILVDPCIEPGYYFECSTDRIILTKPNTTTFTTKHSNFLTGVSTVNFWMPSDSGSKSPEMIHSTISKQHDSLSGNKNL